MKIGKEVFDGVPNRLFYTMGCLLLIVLALGFTLISFGPPITALGSIGNLPVHPLVVHATVVSISMASLGTLALALRPAWRHKYGYLLMWINVLMVFTTWVAVESGNILTEFPGLGSTAHADGGRLLMALIIPFALLSSAMVIIDRFVMVKVNKFGDLYRRRVKKNGKPKKEHHYALRAVCIASSIMAVVVQVQTIIVGHSGAEASWGGIF